MMEGLEHQAPKKVLTFRNYRVSVAEELESLGLSAIVTGERCCPKKKQFVEAAQYHRSHVLWELDNVMAKNVILNKCSDEVFEKSSYLPTACQLWSTLENQYGQGSRDLDHVLDIQDLSRIDFDGSNLDTFLQRFSAQAIAIKMSKSFTDEGMMIGLLLERLEPWLETFTSGLKLKIALAPAKDHLPRLSTILRELKSEWAIKTIIEKVSTEHLDDKMEIDQDKDNNDVSKDKTMSSSSEVRAQKGPPQLRGNPKALSKAASQAKELRMNKCHSNQSQEPHVQKRTQLATQGRSRQSRRSRGSRPTKPVIPRKGALKQQSHSTKAPHRKTSIPKKISSAGQSRTSSFTRHKLEGETRARGRRSMNQSQESIGAGIGGEESQFCRQLSPFSTQGGYSQRMAGSSDRTRSLAAHLKDWYRPDYPRYSTYQDSPPRVSRLDDSYRSNTGTRDWYNRQTAADSYCPEASYRLEGGYRPGGSYPPAYRSRSHSPPRSWQVRFTSQATTTSTAPKPALQRAFPNDSKTNLNVKNHTNHSRPQSTIAGSNKESRPAPLQTYPNDNGIHPNTKNQSSRADHNSKDLTLKLESRSTPAQTCANNVGIVSKEKDQKSESAPTNAALVVKVDPSPAPQRMSRNMVWVNPNMKSQLTHSTPNSTPVKLDVASDSALQQAFGNISETSSKEKGQGFQYTTADIDPMVKAEATLGPFTDIPKSTAPAEPTTESRKLTLNFAMPSTQHLSDAKAYSSIITASKPQGQLWTDVDSKPRSHLPGLH